MMFIRSKHDVKTKTAAQRSQHDSLLLPFDESSTTLLLLLLLFEALSNRFSTY